MPCSCGHTLDRLTAWIDRSVLTPGDESSCSSKASGTKKAGDWQGLNPLVVDDFPRRPIGPAGIRSVNRGRSGMSALLKRLLCAAVPIAIATAAALPSPATAEEKKPNILFIMGDDIGWMQPSIYHRGL